MRYSFPYIEMMLPTNRLEDMCFLCTTSLVYYPLYPYMLPSAPFLGEQKSLWIRSNLSKKNWCQSKTDPRAPTSTHNTHRGKLKFLHPLPSANWTRFASLVGHHIYKEYEEKKSAPFILIEGVWFRQENLVWAHFKGAAMRKNRIWRKKTKRTKLWQHQRVDW